MDEAVTGAVRHGEYGAPPQAHALRVYKRGAEQRGNGAIYRRASFSNHVPERRITY